MTGEWDIKYLYHNPPFFFLLPTPPGNRTQERLKREIGWSCGNDGGGCITQIACYLHISFAIAINYKRSSARRKRGSLAQREWGLS